MRKSEAPHKINMTITITTSTISESNCSCKAWYVLISKEVEVNFYKKDIVTFSFTYSDTCLKWGFFFRVSGTCSHTVGML